MHADFVRAGKTIGSYHEILDEILLMSQDS
jgi:hypothetical protein